MSDKDKLVIIIFFFIFLVSFFFLFFTGPYPNGALFQYLFFIAALTMAFTGFLGATGTFATKDQTLGGGAAIFLVMVLSVVGLKSFFGLDDASAKLVQAVRAITQNETLPIKNAIDYAMNVIEEEPKFKKLKEENSNLTTMILDLEKKVKDSKEKLEVSQKALKKIQDALTACQNGLKECQTKPRELSLVVHPLSSPFSMLLPDEEYNIVNIDGDNNLSGIQKDGKKYRVPLSVLKGGFMMQLRNPIRNQNYKLEPLIVRYDYDNTLLELYATKVSE